MLNCENLKKFHFFCHHNPIYTGRAVSTQWQFQQAWQFQRIEKNIFENKFENKFEKNKKQKSF